MLVQSRWTPEIWLFPKGTVESYETQKQAAARETREEAGVAGDLGPKLGVWSIKRGTKVKQKMWVLFVTTEYSSDNKQWKERKKRARGWYSFDEAKQIITALPASLLRPELLEMLMKTQSTLADIDSGVTSKLSSESDDDEETLDSSPTDAHQ
ncbi:diphosphoinositol polyphosphate phosphohydrolase-like protein [Gracilaria domingensis]|nr:diphosphoinositol polyphosphate phosphohydrolase-like protein [Gracilaria domingensis]